MPPTTHASHSPVALLVTGLACLVVIAVAMIFASRALRAQLTLESGGSRHGDRITRTAGSATSAALPAGVARTLAARGLVNGKQLASMSPTEREFFLATVAAKLGDGSKPRLVGKPTPASGTAVAPGGATSAAAAEQIEVIDPLPPAALVSGSIHCPVCRTPVGQRTEKPLQMSRCPGCSRRVGVRVEGDRLTVTVDYTLRTPAAGVGKIRE
jgi:hypothetical protein